MRVLRSSKLHSLLIACLASAHDGPSLSARAAAIRPDDTLRPPPRALPAIDPPFLTRRAPAPPRSAPHPPRDAPRASSGPPELAPAEAAEDSPTFHFAPPRDGPTYSPEHTALHRAEMARAAADHRRALAAAGASWADFHARFDRRVHELHPARHADFVVRLHGPRVVVGPQGARGRLHQVVDEAVERALRRTHAAEWARSREGWCRGREAARGRSAMEREREVERGRERLRRWRAEAERRALSRVLSRLQLPRK